MKWMIVLFFLHINEVVFAQDSTPSRLRFTVGLSAPEMLHAGLLYRIVNRSAVGCTIGLGPSYGKAWTSLSLEHRFYFGRNAQKDHEKYWFFRQGTTYFPSATIPSQHFTINLSAGKDISFKNSGKGITIDVGVFYLPDSEQSSIILVRSLNLWPSLRFQLYF